MEKSDINVLIVDDDETQREVLDKAISRKGYRTISVGKPEEAESMIRIKPVHALIVDCMLPGKSGVDLVSELREKAIESAPVFLISGIYRDRAFSTEALQKTGALEFFKKPFDLNEVLASLEKSLAKYVKAPKLGLQSLLSAPLSSERERRRALDYVDGLTGYDLPFVFSILMDSEATGHLNIFDEDYNIFGVSFNKGTIHKVDSEVASENIKAILLKEGLVTHEDLKEIEDQETTNIAKILVERGLISPHAKELAKEKQVVKELNDLVTAKPIKINFVQDRKLEKKELGLSAREFLPQLHDMVVSQIPVSYLKKFYATWTGHALRPGPNYQDSMSVAEFDVIKKLPNLASKIKGEPNLEDLHAEPDYMEEDFYRGLHLMSIRRIVVFSETASVKDLDNYVRRLKATYDAVKDQDPVTVFKYFGLGNNPRAHDVAHTYKEFAKANHPDLVPEVATPDVRDLNHRLFALVTDAHDILTNEDKKEKYYTKIKQSDMENQIKAEDLLTEAYNFISRSQFDEAKRRVDIAVKLHTSDKGILYNQWVTVKLGKNMRPELVADGLTELDKVTQEGKRTALFYFVRGLIYKASGSPAEAFKSFVMSQKADPNFTHARREMAALKSALPKKMDMSELMNADLGTVFSKLFKKKGA